MIENIAALLGIGAVFLFVFGLLEREGAVLGVFGAVIIIFLGLMIMNEGLQYRTGEVLTVTTTSVTSSLSSTNNLTFDVTSNANTTGNSSSTGSFVYSDVTFPFFDFKLLGGLFTVLVGIILLYVFAMKATETTSN